MARKRNGQGVVKFVQTNVNRIASTFSTAIQAFVPEVSVRKSDKVILFGNDDLAPNRVTNAIMDSGTANRAVNKLAKFIVGHGYTVSELNTAKANKYQNNIEFARDYAAQIAAYGGCYIKIMYSLDLTRVTYKVMPFDKVRRVEDGRYLYNKNKGEKDFKKSEDIFFDGWCPNISKDEISQRIGEQTRVYGGQTGFIYFDYGKSLKTKWYPINAIMSGVEDIESDAALQKLENRNIRKGFKGNVIISYNGEIDDVTEDDNGKTELDRFNDNIKQFAGEDGSSIMVLFGKTPETTPNVTPFPVSEILDGVDKARDRVARFVCRHVGTPPVLIGMSTTEGLGNTQAIVNNLKIFSNDVADFQAMLCGFMGKMYRAMGLEVDFEISPLKIIDEIPNEVYAALTQDEIRELGGYPALNESKNTPLALQLGTDAMIQLQDILISPELQAEQKVQSITILFGITEENARKMVYGNNTPTA